MAHLLRRLALSPPPRPGRARPVAAQSQETVTASLITQQQGDWVYAAMLPCYEAAVTRQLVVGERHYRWRRYEYSFEVNELREWSQRSGLQLPTPLTRYHLSIALYPETEFVSQRRFKPAWKEKQEEKPLPPICDDENEIVRWLDAQPFDYWENKGKGHNYYTATWFPQQLWVEDDGASGSDDERYLLLGICHKIDECRGSLWRSSVLQNLLADAQSGHCSWPSLPDDTDFAALMRLAIDQALAGLLDDEFEDWCAEHPQQRPLVSQRAAQRFEALLRARMKLR